jgi:hypothetical protein
MPDMTRVAMALLMLAAAASAVSYTYNVNRTVFTNGNATSSVSNLNADDAAYYDISSSGYTLFNNNSVNTNVGMEVGSPPTNWTEGTSAEDSGQTEPATSSISRVNRGPTPNALELDSRQVNAQVGTTYSSYANQTLVVALNDTTNNYINWTMGINTLVSAVNYDHEMSCLVLVGSVAGVGNNRLYYCWMLAGTLPADTSTRKYVEVTTANAVTGEYRNITRNVTSDVWNEWGSGSNYSFNHTRVLNRWKPTVQQTTQIESDWDNIHVVKVDALGRQAVSVELVSATINQTFGNFNFESVNATLNHKANASQAEYLSIFNWATDVWETCQTATVTTTETTFNCNKTANMTDYLNQANNTVHVRLNSTVASAAFQSNLDLLKFFITGTANPPSLTLSSDQASSCPSTLYYRVVMQGTSFYDVYLKSPTGTVVQQSLNQSNATLSKTYVFTSTSEPGNYTVLVEDREFNVKNNTNVTLKTGVTGQTAGVVTNSYVGIAESSSSNLNLYSFNGTASCEVTIHNSGGSIGAFTTLSVSGSTVSRGMSSFAGGMSYPVGIRVKCDKNIVAALDPHTEGITILQNPSQLTKTMYGAMVGAGTTPLRIFAYNGAVNYVISTFRDTGTLDTTLTGTVAANNSVEISVPSAGTPAGLNISLSTPASVYYEPDARNAIPYFSGSLINEGFTPVHDEGSTSFVLYAPFAGATVTLTAYPPSGFVDAPFACNKTVFLDFRTSVTVNYKNEFINQCSGVSQLYAGTPSGSVFINSTSPIVVGFNPWANRHTVTPTSSRQGSFFPQEFFALSFSQGISGMDWMVMNPYPNTAFKVNGVSYFAANKYTLYTGSVSETYVNVSADLPISLSVGSGQSQSIIAGTG